MENRFRREALAGVLIGIAGCIYLLTENRLLGALFFTIGLLAIFGTGGILFTGIAGNAVWSRRFIFLVEVLLFNTAGAVFMGILTRYVPGVTEIVNELITVKLAKGYSYALTTGAMCGMLMYLAWKMNQSRSMYSLPVILLCVITFVSCGFEHSIADMYYLFAGAPVNPEFLLYTLTAASGNVVGAFILAGFAPEKGKS